MKRYVILVIIFGSLLGYFFGNIFYHNYRGKEYINSDGNIYYIQYGVYTNEETAVSNSKNLSYYFLKEIDDKFYVFLGITADYGLALELQKKYLEDNIYTYIRSDYVENSEDLEKLKAYDERIKNTSSEEIGMVMQEIFSEWKFSF